MTSPAAAAALCSYFLPLTLAIFIITNNVVGPERFITLRFAGPYLRGWPGGKCVALLVKADLFKAIFSAFFCFY